MNLTLRKGVIGRKASTSL